MSRQTTAIPSEPEVLAVLEAIGREKLDWDGALSRELSLGEAMELDSMRLLTLVVEVEDRFEICLEESDEIGIETVGDLIDVVRARRSDADAEAST